MDRSVSSRFAFSSCEEPAVVSGSLCTEARAAPLNQSAAGIAPFFWVSGAFVFFEDLLRVSDVVVVLELVVEGRWLAVQISEYREFP